MVPIDQLSSQCLFSPLLGFHLDVTTHIICIYCFSFRETLFHLEKPYRQYGEEAIQTETLPQ